MASPKQVVEKIYEDISRSNLSSVLPILDEHITIYMASSLPDGGEFHGRDGFMSMIARRFQLWERFEKTSFQYFLSESESDNGVVVTGNLTGKLLTVSESIIMPFVDQWRLRDGKVIEYRVFYWDAIRLMQYIQPLSFTPSPSQNGSSSN
ncbi:nuclear transport factor 2 family protein [Spirosoma endbachense]|uniref:SnoaL-like domain-containing protein n=1 Tax=Spirosoma endbachense TaxID=2666025 RepID=A0A6P1W6N5_9BACT|nr:nuclear transport factor 2 family protein [Spirosoma endbachense]QHV99376.1 hypothetical protein GJR95_32115 [Spirosoma endbachense]